MCLLKLTKQNKFARILLGNLDIILLLISIPLIIFSAYTLNINHSIYHVLASIIISFIIMVYACHVYNTTYEFFTASYVSIKLMSRYPNEYLFNMKKIFLLFLSVACPTYLLNNDFESPVAVAAEILGKIFFIAIFPTLPLLVMYLAMLLAIFIVDRLFSIEEKIEIM